MNITEMELQNLRHLIQFSETDMEKYNAYAKEATDPTVKQFFQKTAQCAAQNRQTFIQFLKQEGSDMQEKAMVSDALNCINSGLKAYEEMITQTEHQELRQTLQKMRNETETSQYELFTIAKSKNYYEPAQMAKNEEVDHVKSCICGCAK